MQLVKREILQTGGKGENSSESARNLKVRPQGDITERDPVTVFQSSRGGVRGEYGYAGGGEVPSHPLNRGDSPPQR